MPTWPLLPVPFPPAPAWVCCLQWRAFAPPLRECPRTRVFAARCDHRLVLTNVPSCPLPTTLVASALHCTALHCHAQSMYKSRAMKTAKAVTVQHDPAVVTVMLVDRRDGSRTFDNVVRGVRGRGAGMACVWAVCAPRRRVPLWVHVPVIPAQARARFVPLVANVLRVQCTVCSCAMRLCAPAPCACAPMCCVLLRCVL